MLALGRQAHSCLSQSCLNASVIDGAPIGEIVAAPLINCRMSESLKSKILNDIFTGFSKLLWPHFTFCRETGNILSFNRKSRRSIMVKISYTLLLNFIEKKRIVVQSFLRTTQWHIKALDMAR